MLGLGAEVARLAGRLAADGNPNLRGDAVTGLLLAEAGVELPRCSSASTWPAHPMTTGTQEPGIAAGRGERGAHLARVSSHAASMISGADAS